MSESTKRAAIYLRVSTGEQTTDNQHRELEAAAKVRGWQVVEVYEDAGISGSKGRDKRPGLDRMLKAAVKGRFDVVMAWAVDRLGRSLPDLISTMQELRAAEVDLFLHQQGLDTATASGRAMFGMLGVFAEFEREMIRARVNAGLARAKARGKVLGRPRIDRKLELAVRGELAKGAGIRETARLTGASVSTVQRLKGAIAE